MWPEAKLEQALAQERVWAGESYEVVFGILLVDRRFDDLDTRNSSWRLSLSTEQGEVTPLAIRRIGRAGEGIRAYLPVHGRFLGGVLGAVPRTVGDRSLVGPQTQTVTFRLGSSLGQAVMSFPVEPAAPTVRPPRPQPPCRARPGPVSSGPSRRAGGTRRSRPGTEEGPLVARAFRVKSGSWRAGGGGTAASASLACSST
jgi:hypothetical protein